MCALAGGGGYFVITIVRKLALTGERRKTGSLEYENPAYRAATMERGDITIYGAAFTLYVLLLANLAQLTPVLDAAD